jgi:hypothetical protein
LQEAQNRAIAQNFAQAQAARKTQNQAMQQNLQNQLVKKRNERRRRSGSVRLSAQPSLAHSWRVSSLAWGNKRNRLKTKSRRAKTFSKR